MSRKSFSVESLMKLTVIFLFLICNGFAVYSQNSPDGTRGMVAKEYAKGLQNRILARRPKSTTPKPIKKPKPIESFRYIPPKSDDAPIAQGIDIGVTFWRLRESTVRDDLKIVEKRKIVRKKGQAVETVELNMTPVCAESGVQFADGDQLQIAVEIPIEGYIYIFNREQYADGTLGDPDLIFPCSKDAGKADRSIPGKLVFIPKEKDYFEIQKSARGDIKKTGEFLIMLVTPQRLAELPILDDCEKPIKTDLKLFENLEKSWGGRTWKFAQKGKAGKAITIAEKNAGVTGDVTLTNTDEHLPQTIYHIENKPGNPVLFTVPIQIRR